MYGLVVSRHVLVLHNISNKNTICLAVLIQSANMENIWRHRKATVLLHRWDLSFRVTGFLQLLARGKYMQESKNKKRGRVELVETDATVKLSANKTQKSTSRCQSYPTRLSGRSSASRSKTPRGC